MQSPALVARTSLQHLLESLNPKERLYVQARAQGSVPAAAARVAGYVDPDTKAGELEQNTMVRTAIEYVLRVQAHEQVFTKRDVVNGIHDAIHVAGTAGEKISGWKEIGKIEGHYAPTKVKVEGEIRHTKEAVQKLSDEELAQMAAIEGEFVRLDDSEETA